MLAIRFIFCDGLPNILLSDIFIFISMSQVEEPKQQSTHRKSMDQEHCKIEDNTMEDMHWMA